MLNWKKEKLVDVADIKMSNVDKKTHKDEIPIQLCNYTDVYKNSYINRDKSLNFMFASCKQSEYDKFVLRKGQVAITKDSEKANDIGIPTYISESLDNVLLGYHLSLITPSEKKLDGKFLRYWLDTKQAKTYFENNASGSGQRYFLALDTVKDIPLFLPELTEQQKISNLLFNLDSKIELNDKINKELEAMAKTLYDYWFVQFDFPDENGKPYKSSGGKMVYNKELKREIPEGWEVKNLTDFYDFLEGPGITKEKYSENGHKFINIKCINNEDLEVSNASMIKDSYIEGYKHFLLKENDIVLSTSGTLGRSAIVRKAHLPLLLNTSVIRFRAKKENIFEYMYLYLKSEYFLNNLNKMATGSIQKNFGPTHLEQIVEVFPIEDVLNTFNKILKSIVKKLISNKEQNQELANLRDWLLPMLMNGQVRVKI